MLYQRRGSDGEGATAIAQGRSLAPPRNRIEEIRRDRAHRPGPARPERVVHQASACVFVLAPSPEAAVETAARRIRPMGGWRAGPDVANEVFARSEYRDHANPGDYTRSVIIAVERLRGAC